MALLTQWREALARRAPDARVLRVLRPMAEPVALRPVVRAETRPAAVRVRVAFPPRAEIRPATLFAPRFKRPAAPRADMRPEGVAEETRAEVRPEGVADEARAEVRPVVRAEAPRADAPRTFVPREARAIVRPVERFDEREFLAVL